MLVWTSSVKVFTTVKKVTIVSSTSLPNLNRKQNVTQTKHIMCLNLFVALCGDKIITYFKIFKLWFTLSASASVEAPKSPIPLLSRL